MESYRIRVKPVTTPPKTPDKPQGRDTFETPNYATELLLPFIPDNIVAIWECASGSGRIARVFDENGYTVIPSDIRDFGNNYLHNFLNGDYFQEAFNYGDMAIVTNPPFSIKEEFINKAVEYDVPFAFLINADYHQKHIYWIQELGCEKIIPNRRIAFITPNVVNRVNEKEGTEFTDVYQIPNKLLYKYSAAQFHSMWLTRGFNLGRTETFVDLSLKEMKENI